MTTNTRPDLALILADLRGDAAVLRRNGHESEATLCERIATDVATAAEEWITFISESDAMLRSGRSKDWHRSRFAEWERDGHARLSGNKQRQYRMAIIPRRYHLSDAREAGAAAARRAKVG